MVLLAQQLVLQKVLPSGSISLLPLIVATHLDLAPQLMVRMVVVLSTLQA